jgi:hypothetical protein
VRRRDLEPDTQPTEFYLERCRARCSTKASAKALPELHHAATIVANNGIEEKFTLRALERGVGASMRLSASVEVSTLESSRRLTPLDSKLLGGLLEDLRSEGQVLSGMC